MKLIALHRAFAWAVAISLLPTVLVAQSCKCPKNPGPGGGVHCASNQIATCDPTSGECNCTCDSAEQGKTKEEYEAQIFSKVLHTEVNPNKLSDPQYKKFVSSFRKSDGEGTFKFDKEGSPKGSRQVEVGVPGWLEDVLRSKGGTSLGPGASLQNCPNGICIGGENSGTATVNNFAPPERHLTPAQIDALTIAAASMPEDASSWFSVEATSQPEATNFGDEIRKVFSSRRRAPPDLTIRLFEVPPIPRGVYVIVLNDHDVHFPIAQQIADALGGSGMPVTFESGRDLKPGQVKIVVGVQ